MTHVIIESMVSDLDISPSQLKSLDIDCEEVLLIVFVDLFHEFPGRSFEIELMLHQDFL